MPYPIGRMMALAVLSLPLLTSCQSATVPTSGLDSATDRDKLLGKADGSGPDFDAIGRSLAVPVDFLCRTYVEARGARCLSGVGRDDDGDGMADGGSYRGRHGLNEAQCRCARDRNLNLCREVDAELITAILDAIWNDPDGPHLADKSVLEGILIVLLDLFGPEPEQDSPDDELFDLIEFGPEPDRGIEPRHQVYPGVSDVAASAVHVLFDRVLSGDPEEPGTSCECRLSCQCNGAPCLYDPADAPRGALCRAGVCAQCQADSDCRGDGARCELGQCVNPAGGTAEPPPMCVEDIVCRDNSDCDGISSVCREQTDGRQLCEDPDGDRDCAYSYAGIPSCQDGYCAYVGSPCRYTSECQRRRAPGAVECIRDWCRVPCADDAGCSEMPHHVCRFSESAGRNTCQLP